ncbi:hypothetical protein [Nostoc sp. T09]
MGYIAYSYVNFVTFSPDRQTIASGDKTIKIWRCD